MTDEKDNVTPIGEAKPTEKGKTKTTNKPADKGPAKAVQPAPGVKHIHDRLNDFTMEFDGVVRGRKNDFYDSEYANIDDVWEAIKPLIKKHGIAISQMPGSYALPEQLVPTLITQLYCVGPNSPACGEPGWQLSTQSPLKIEKQSSQGIGAALTYARRQHIVTMLNICDFDDDGQNEEEERLSRQVTEGALQELKELIDKASDPKATTKFLIGRAGVAGINCMKPADVASSITLIKSKMSEKK